MSHIPSPESPQAPRSWPQPLQMAASTTERQLRSFFFFFLTRLLAVIGFRLKQPRPHRERRAQGRGRREAVGEGRDQRREQERARNPVRRLSRRKIKKRERGDEQTGAFKTDPLISTWTALWESKLSAYGRQRRPEGVAARPQGLGPAAEPAWPGCPDSRGPCLPPHDPPAVCCSRCSRSPPRSPPSALPRAASAPK